MPGPVRMAIVFVRTVAVVGAAVGFYSLLVGSFAPGQLADSIPGINAGRTDTVGVAAIAGSAVCFSVVRLAAVGGRAGLRGPARELLRIVAVYAGTIWAYLAVNTITHDRSRVLPATHLSRYPDEQQLARICLVLAAVALFAFWALRPARPLPRARPGARAGSRSVGRTAGDVDVVARARAIAEDAHAGQRDRAGEPYLGHPARVAAAMAGDERAEAVGWLHDVLEDSAWTADGLLDAGMPCDVVEAVVALTHGDGESDQRYWARVRANPLARRVKLEGDLADNADPDRLARLDPEVRTRLEAKYRRARQALER